MLYVLQYCLEVENEPDGNDGENEHENFVGHMFQYQIWKKSLDVQYIVEAFVVLLKAIFLLTCARYMTDTGKVVKIQQKIVDKDPSSENYPKLGGLSDDYLRCLNASLII